MSDRYDLLVDRHDTLVKLLINTGWIDGSLPVGKSEISSAINEYQEFHGLKVDGWVGQITERSLIAPRMCGLPDVIRLGSDLPRFLDSHITWLLKILFKVLMV